MTKGMEGRTLAGCTPGYEILYKRTRSVDDGPIVPAIPLREASGSLHTIVPQGRHSQGRGSDSEFRIINIPAALYSGNDLLRPLVLAGSWSGSLAPVPSSGLKNPG
jgi:hypothetical protein